MNGEPRRASDEIIHRVDEKIDALRDFVAIRLSMIDDRESRNHVESVRRLDVIEQRVTAQNGRIAKLEIDRKVGHEIARREQSADDSGSRIKVAKIGMWGLIITAALTSAGNFAIRLFG
jgi:hypothetical protein